MVEIVPGWHVEVDSDAEWTFMRLHPPMSENLRGRELADGLWRTLRERFCVHLILELEPLEYVTSQFLRQLLLLQDQLREEGGLLLLAGMSHDAYACVTHANLNERFPFYTDRGDAISGYRPNKPR